MKTTDQCTCPEVDVISLGEPPRPVEAIVRGLAAACPVHGENAWAARRRSIPVRWVTGIADAPEPPGS